VLKSCCFIFKSKNLSNFFSKIHFLSYLLSLPVDVIAVAVVAVAVVVVVVVVVAVAVVDAALADVAVT
jgi:hypothetical protein